MRQLIQKIKMSYILGVCVATVLFGGKVIHAAVNQQDTETAKVTVDKTVSIADTQEYKNMDYSFMKTFKYGSVVKASEEFETVEDDRINTIHIVYNIIRNRNIVFYLFQYIILPISNHK